ncbi:MAG: zinc ABC transporter substrate-binding protein [Pseudobutyrivibrio sp.]|nr:zinc ABC transporter substrate-binding protein [Pseudobutyrivibrio sp.]
MKKSKYFFVLLMLISISVVCFCSTFFYVKNKESKEDAKLLVMTSCNPVYLATINVAGDIDGVTVTNLSQPTTGCLHDYTLTTEDMKNLSKADVLVVNGAGMEGYLDDVIAAYPNLPIIDASKGIMDTISGSLSTVEAAKLERLVRDNSHMWMAEVVQEGQAYNIAKGLAAIDSAHTKEYADAAKTYCSVIEQRVDKGSTAEALKGANVAILHEAFEYTAFSYGANVVAVMDLDEERQVSAGEVSEFIDAINDNDVQIVFAEYDYGNAMGKLITEQTDAKVVYLETLVHGDYSGLDYITTINKNYALIDSVLSGLMPVEE